MSTTTLLVAPGDRPRLEITDLGGRREGAIRAGVLAALGRPDRLYRVNVVPLWGDHFRVNVITGDDPSAVRIPHSYFVAADGLGNILRSDPGIRREYPPGP
jgi:hypothetical protein